MERRDFLKLAALSLLAIGAHLLVKKGRSEDSAGKIIINWIPEYGENIANFFQDAESPETDWKFEGIDVKNGILKNSYRRFQTAEVVRDRIDPNAVVLKLKNPEPRAFLLTNSTSNQAECLNSNGVPIETNIKPVVLLSALNNFRSAKNIEIAILTSISIDKNKAQNLELPRSISNSTLRGEEIEAANLPSANTSSLPPLRYGVINISKVIKHQNYLIRVTEPSGKYSFYVYTTPSMEKVSSAIT